MKTIKLLCQITFFLGLTTLNTMANNGAIAYIYPISGISIDGNLSDWPSDILPHQLQTIHYGKIEDSTDAFAVWRAGYNAEEGALYFAVTMCDDDYVKTPNNSHYSTHDFHVLYLDPIHSVKGDGVIAYEIDEDHKKIVEQEALAFYDQVNQASFDQIQLFINKVGDQIIYEWKVTVPGQLKSGRVIGFDYAVFDKDKDENNVMITWGRTDGAKFMNANRIGDLILLEKGETTYTASGQLAWKEIGADFWPNTIQFSQMDNPNTFYNTAPDSLGQFSIDLPKGTFEISIPATYYFADWNNIQILKRAVVRSNLEVYTDDILLDTIDMNLARKPTLIQEEGILLHPFSSNQADLVDQFIEAYRDHYTIPAVSLALIQNGALVYHKTYGVENTITKKPLRPEAVFEAASITKLVFAYVMNRLVQRNEFDLDKPLYETLAFPELEQFPEYKLMTARHVLTHVSGLPNWGASMVDTPGTKYGYSGEGFEYLKKVLAGGPTDSLPGIIQAHLEREILHPLGMKNTYFMCNDVLPKRKVAGHFDGIPSMYDCPEWPGMAFSMHTEARDFVPFALALLNRKGLTEEQAHEMFRFHTLYEEEDWLNGYKAGFGLGVALRESPYGLVFGHGGNNGDFRCSFEMYDALKTGYIVFTNANTAEPMLFDLMKFLIEGE